MEYLADLKHFGLDIEQREFNALAGSTVIGPDARMMAVGNGFFSAAYEVDRSETWQTNTLGQAMRDLVSCGLLSIGHYALQSRQLSTAIEAIREYQPIVLFRGTCRRNEIDGAFAILRGVGRYSWLAAPAETVSDGGSDEMVWVAVPARCREDLAAAVELSWATENRLHPAVPSPLHVFDTAPAGVYRHQHIGVDRFLATHGLSGIERTASTIWRWACSERSAAFLVEPTAAGHHTIEIHIYSEMPGAFGLDARVLVNGKPVAFRHEHGPRRVVVGKAWLPGICMIALTGLNETRIAGDERRLSIAVSGVTLTPRRD
ncbi:hypothetical protein DKG75_19815 [Zavarzinia compransoris]|uniref:Uncharacterized protein n=2 Tax=Zavarzinia compransoris TaxID=1264899 RepID=A0A317DU67_9PROT|nr:hypothetical protein DKG75_19815 [Zavarzinia compransoris]